MKERINNFSFIITEKMKIQKKKYKKNEFDHKKA
jgi:hypothetical protein